MEGSPYCTRRMAMEYDVQRLQMGDVVLTNGHVRQGGVRG